MEQLELEALKENAADLQAIDCEPTDKRNPLAHSDRARSIAFSSGSFREHADAVIKQDSTKQDSIKKKKKVKECAVHCLRVLLINKSYLYILAYATRLHPANPTFIQTPPINSIKESVISIVSRPSLVR